MHNITFEATLFGYFASPIGYSVLYIAFSFMWILKFYYPGPIFHRFLTIFLIKETNVTYVTPEFILSRVQIILIHEYKQVLMLSVTTINCVLRVSSSEFWNPSGSRCCGFRPKCNLLQASTSRSWRSYSEYHMHTRALWILGQCEQIRHTSTVRAFAATWGASVWIQR